MKYGLHRMLCALALTRFPNWARRYESQELANSSRWINGMPTGRLLLIRLSGRISKNVEIVTRKEAIFSAPIAVDAIVPYHLTTLNDYLYSGCGTFFTRLCPKSFEQFLSRGQGHCQSVIPVFFTLHSAQPGRIPQAGRPSFHRPTMMY
jgi:hypothetical protein